ncbi:Six-hairpin glycosidase-like protein [Mycena olivaceomarginata]|nr:Six-hairpin glycosidase-like protein [Mycena olivaceomarginata]
MKLMLSSVVLAPLPRGGRVGAVPGPTRRTHRWKPQGNPSTGRWPLPFMRPTPGFARTFNSTAVEVAKVITDMKARLKDPESSRGSFENTFPNTLDTTVKYFNATQNLAFIINCAQWLRDTANQFAHYTALLPLDPSLATLVRAVINNEARYVSAYPYCGSFQPPPESGLKPSHNDWADGVTVNPPVDNQTVFECKYEIDSLCGFLKLTLRFMNDNWYSAVTQIFRVINEQSQPSFDANFNRISYYNWTGGNGALSPAVTNQGNGEPKAYTVCMVGTHHRPSDDISIFAFLTPANAMLSVELAHLADVLTASGQAKTALGANFTKQAKTWSKRVHDSVGANTLVDNIFAYETNGFGGRYVMDDANVPLLLSKGNPYFAQGANFSGTGGPHVDAWHPWPMSQISAIFGTDDDEEILRRLNTAGLGLIHESQSIYSPTDYTRGWFAWANSYFAEMLLDLAQRKPGLIFKTNTPYTPGK